jgi:hypothetical protein
MADEGKETTQESGAGDKPSVDEARRQQHTGNHDRPERETGGADRFGGTRAGAANVEPGGKKRG